MRTDWEHLRMVSASAISPVLAYYTPTKGFLLALVLAFAFNIYAGMKADGVSFTCCENFSFGKFKNALAELVLYVVIICFLFTVMSQCGDGEAAFIVVKSLTYVFMYVYVQNAVKNLIKVHPTNIALRIVYHAVRLEFARMLPSYWKPIVERVEQERQEAKEKEKK